MAPKTEKTVVALGRTTSVDAEMDIAAVAESVNVVAESSPVVSNTVVGANYTAAEINALPNGRTPQLVAELAPGLTDNTPNTEQVTISGGFAFDNVFLIDGVDVNDNIFGIAKQSLHRGRGRRDADPDVRHFRRVRPLQRRRRERRHQAWRQPVLGQLPRQPE